jgi:phenylalanyl-tRNA synthetase alpha chain
LESHQKQKYTRQGLLEVVNLIFKVLIPGYEPIIYEAKHPYTLDGIEVYAKVGGQMIEILEAGLAHPEVLAGSGLNPQEYTGLALGTGFR